MLLANREVAEYIHRAYRNTPVEEGFIYRVHDLPDQDKLQEIGTLVRGLGYQFGQGKQKISNKDINNLFAQIEGSPIEGLIKTAMVRSMAKAVYATKNIGHFGLGFKHYTHFTSPIRRYSDLLVHRILQNHLEKKKVSEKDLTRYRLIADSLSTKEAAIQRAERESISYKQVEYMAARIGQTFEGIITGVTEWGLYIEEIETGAEGLIKIRELTDDYYLLEEKKYRLKGEKTGKTYTLGDRVRFKVSGADMDRKILDYTLV
jgi:ribonuclease R